LHEIIEGRMRGKPTTCWRRIQILHDLANDGGYFAQKGCQNLFCSWRGRPVECSCWSESLLGLDKALSTHG